MKKLESSLKNMALALTGFSVVAGGLLGWVNDITAEPIAQANAKTLSDAIAVVVPGFDNNPAEAPETASRRSDGYVQPQSQTRRDVATAATGRKIKEKG